MFITLLSFLFRGVVYVLAFLFFIVMLLFFLELLFPPLRIFKIHPWNSSKKKDAPLKQNITISINVNQKSSKYDKN